MKRSEALVLIANQLDFLAGKFAGMRSDFSDDEMGNADVILTTLEQAGMLPPRSEFEIAGRKMSDNFWEPENESNQKGV